jgi:hypothetical protein
VIRVVVLMLAVHVATHLVVIARERGIADMFSLKARIAPLWVRACLPLPIAAGIWLGQEWAWWAGLLLSAASVLWQSFALPSLVRDGFFRGPTAPIRVFCSILLFGTMAIALIALSFHRGSVKVANTFESDVFKVTLASS